MDIPKRPQLSREGLGTIPQRPVLSRDRVYKETAFPETKPQEVQPPEPPPEPVKPEWRVKDDFGWLLNLPESTLKLAKSMVWDLPKAAITSAIHYGKDPGQYTKDLNLMFAKNNGLGGFFKDSFTNYYAKDFWKNFNEDPAQAFSDFAAIVSLGGTAGAKLAGVAGKVAVKSSGMAARPFLRNAAKVAGTAEAVAEVGNYADPLQWIAKGTARAAKPLLTGLGFDHHSPDIAHISARLASQQALQSNAELVGVITGKLKPVENALLERNIRWGWAHELETLGSDVTSTVGKRWKTWREAITNGDEPLFKSLFKMDDETAKTANAVKASEYSKEHWKELGLDGPKTPIETRAMMDAGQINPTFMSSFRLQSKDARLADMLMKGNYRGGFLARMEKMRGGGLVERDMNKVMARQIMNKHDALFKLNLIKEVKGYLAERGEIHLRVPGDAMPVPQGYSLLQDAFYQKYFGDAAQSAGINMDFLSKTDDPVRGLAGAEQSWRQNHHLLKAVAQSGDVYVPTAVAAWLNRELAPISGAGAMLDKYTGKMKRMMTLFNPKFWPAVMFGNTTLGALYGASPDMARVASKFKGDMPMVLKNIAMAEKFLLNEGVGGRVVENFGRFAQWLDEIVRNPIFVAELAKNPQARMMFAGKSFFTSVQDVGRMVQHFGKTPELLGKTRVAIQELKNQLAVSIGEILTLKQREAISGMKLTKAAASEGRHTPMAPGYNELGQKIEAPERPVDVYPEGSGKAVASAPQETPFDPITGREIPRNEGKDILDPSYVADENPYKFIPEAYLQKVSAETDMVTGATRYVELSREETKAIANQFTVIADDLATLAKATDALRKTPGMVLRPGDFPFKAARNGDALVGKGGSDAMKAITEIAKDLKAQFTHLASKFNEAERIRKGFMEMVRYKALRKQPLQGKVADYHFAHPQDAPKPYDQYAGSGGSKTIVDGAVDVSKDPITGNTIVQTQDKHWYDVGGEKPVPLTPVQERMVTHATEAGNLEELRKSLEEDAIRKLAELGELQAKIPELRAHAAITDKAIDGSNRMFGSFAHLNPFERKILRRALPFYTFNKAMTMLAFRLPYLYPKRVFIGTHLAQAWWDLMGDDNEKMHPSLRNYVPVMALQDGSVVAISAGAINPMGGARMGSIGETPIPGFVNPLTAHPVIQLMLKMNGATPEWNAKPLSPGTYATRLDNGTVVQWTGKGFKTVVAQPSFIKGLFDLFPQAQLIDRLIRPYAQSDRGWLFNPDPISGPDGKPRYPKELADRLWSMVIPTTTYNPEEMRRGEAARMVAVMKSYQKDLKYATPVRRAQILEILSAWRDEKNRKWVQ